MSIPPHDTPTRATAEQGEVMLDGPNGIATSLTPAAARRSADAIHAAAAEAERQRDEQPPRRPATPPKGKGYPL